MILPVARMLGIPRDRVYANTILFNEAGTPGLTPGSYAGFDRAAPTSRDGGKAEVVLRVKAAGGAVDAAGGGGHSGPVVVMVGDGATDMQARPPADAFIGYGGVVVRDAVARGADWFITDFGDLADAVARPRGGSSTGRGDAGIQLR
jgi:phosphoserine phosphatase